MRILLFVMLLCGMQVTAYSQSVVSGIQLEGQPSVQRADGTDSLYRVVWKVSLADTINIGVIELKIGSTPDGGDKFSQEYVFDQTTGLPAGMAYEREAYEVRITIGDLYVDNRYYYQVKLLDFQREEIHRFLKQY